jgi:hypothetical protein
VSAGALGAGATAAGAGGAGVGGAIATLKPGTLMLGVGAMLDGGEGVAAGGALFGASLSLPPRPFDPTFGPAWVPQPSIPPKSFMCPFGSRLLIGSLSA